MDELIRIIDEFVVYTVRERCQGCKDCEPLMPNDWMEQGHCCCEEGFAKWLLEVAMLFKNEKAANHTKEKSARVQRRRR